MPPLRKNRIEPALEYELVRHLPNCTAEVLDLMAAVDDIVVANTNDTYRKLITAHYNLVQAIDHSIKEATNNGSS